MIERRPPAPADVARAARAEEARDVEPLRPAGARSGLLHDFVCPRPPPHRPHRVQVFPYDDPAWKRTLADVLALEARAWQGFWAWVRDGLGHDAHGVYRVAPLSEPVDVAVFLAEIGPLALPALVRPDLEWPDLERAGLPEVVERRLWDDLRMIVIPTVATASGRPLVAPERPDPIPDVRRRLLTDGRRVVPTCWWAFDPGLHHLDRARPVS